MQGIIVFNTEVGNDTIAKVGFSPFSFRVHLLSKCITCFTGLKVLNAFTISNDCLILYSGEQVLVTIQMGDLRMHVRLLPLSPPVFECNISYQHFESQGLNTARVPWEHQNFSEVFMRYICH
jgi:hypothetical protein